MERELNCAGGEVRMVRRGGHESGRTAGGRWWRHALTLALVAAAMAATPSPAAAQAAIGFHGGVAADSDFPEQVFGGTFFQTGDIGRGIRLRFGVDGATGDDWRVGTVGADFVYGYPINGGWTLLAGGGPAVVIRRIPSFDYRDTGVGFHSMVGFGHDSGFFLELRLGNGDAQQLKLGVGWAIRLE